MSEIAKSQNTPEYGYLRDLIGHLVGLTHVQATQICSAELEPLGLTTKQAVTLYFISENANLAQKDLASGVGTSPTVMVGILDVLAKQELIERVPSQIDRRSLTVELTQAGKKMLPQVKKAFFRTEEELELKANLTKKERKDLILLLQKLAKR